MPARFHAGNRPATARPPRRPARCRAMAGCFQSSSGSPVHVCTSSPAMAEAWPAGTQPTSRSWYSSCRCRKASA
ncbi:hypothetical protein C7E15_20815 [Stenotrophomonas maltophilia]|nr:hypothetical protein C7E15_20815 [Stenotrophomonas maltophilia]